MVVEVESVVDHHIDVFQLACRWDWVLSAVAYQCHSGFVVRRLQFRLVHTTFQPPRSLLSPVLWFVRVICPSLSERCRRRILLFWLLSVASASTLRWSAPKYFDFVSTTVAGRHSPIRHPGGARSEKQTLNKLVRVYACVYVCGDWFRLASIHPQKPSPNQWLHIYKMSQIRAWCFYLAPYL